MNAFEEFMFDESYVLRFYRVDHGLLCTINESMVSELREVESKLRQQQAELDAFKLQYYNTGYSIQLIDKDETIRQQQAEISELKHMNRNWQISENILLLELEKLQHRELTDEEITAIWYEPTLRYDPVAFARAILKEAQKK